MITLGSNGVVVPEKRRVLSPEDRLDELMLYYRTRPAAFVQDVIEAEPDPQQIDVLNAMALPGAKVSVRSGRGPGKTAVESWVVIWFLSCFPNCRVPCTASSGHQLFDVLWAEIAKWRGQMNAMFGEVLLQTHEKLVIKGAEQHRFAVARTSRPDQPESLQGFHADNLCFIVDEASGINDAVFIAAEGSLSSKGSRILMASNPTRADGYFFRSHTKDRAEWTCFHLRHDRSRFVDKKWAEEMARKYGEGSNAYKVQVLGEFPTQSDDTLIPIDWVTSAVGRDIELQPAFRKVAGLDVARYGDDANGFIVRQGQVITRIEEWSQCDLMATCGRVAAMYRDEKAFDSIYVDVIGLGSGVVDRLHEMGIPAFGVNVAESPSGMNDGKFMRLRDQLWWGVHEFFEGRGCRIEPGLKLVDQLVSECSGIRYSLTSSGKTLVESKDDMKKRGLASPNCFVAGTMVTTPCGRVRIEDVIEGDEVSTPWGNRRVIRCHRETATRLSRVVFSNDSMLCGTGNHEVFSFCGGFVRLDALALVNGIETDATSRRLSWKIREWLFTRDTRLGFRDAVNTLPQTRTICRSDFYTGLCMQTIMVRFLKALRSTTRMVTDSIMPSRTCRLLSVANTSAVTCESDLMILRTGSTTQMCSQAFETRLPNGMDQTRDGNGTPSMESEPGSEESRSSPSARYAGRNTKPSCRQGAGFVPSRAPRKRAIFGIRRLAEYVLSAAKNLCSTSIGSSRVVPVSVETCDVAETPVYNLTLSEDNVYYANGILVKNCADALCLTFAPGPAVSMVQSRAKARNVVVVSAAGWT